jgi:hypothetical protein
MNEMTEKRTNEKKEKNNVLGASSVYCNMI